MKSDRDFIDGIYKKAAGCKETSSIEKENKSQSKLRLKKWNTAISFAVVLLTGVLCIGLIVDSRKDKNNESILKQNALSIQDGEMMQDDEIIPDDADKTGRRNFDTRSIPQPFTNSITDDILIDLNILHTEAAKSDIVISGKIINTYNENGFIYNEMQVGSCYKGNVDEESIIIMDLPEPLGIITDFTECHMLLFLNNEVNNIYKLADAGESIFLYSENIELEGIYERYDGARIYESELYIGMFTE